MCIYSVLHDYLYYGRNVINGIFRLGSMALFCLHLISDILLSRLEQIEGFVNIKKGLWYNTTGIMLIYCRDRSFVLQSLYLPIESQRICRDVFCVCFFLCTISSSSSKRTYLQRLSIDVHRKYRLYNQEHFSDLVRRTPFAYSSVGYASVPSLLIIVYISI